MIRVVIDTNILISALLGPGKTRPLVQGLLKKHTVIISKPMLAEVTECFPYLRVISFKDMVYEWEVGASLVV